MAGRCGTAFAIILVAALLAAGAGDANAKAKSTSIAWTPPSYDFGYNLSGYLVYTTLTLANTGKKPSGTLAFDMTGSSEFRMVGGTCTPTTSLGAGESCTVTVAYHVTVLGPQEATLTAASTTGAMATATITGTGFTY